MPSCAAARRRVKERGLCEGEGDVQLPGGSARVQRLRRELLAYKLETERARLALGGVVGELHGKEPREERRECLEKEVGGATR